MGADWIRVKEIFAACYELPAEQRQHFLQEACGADRELHSEVQSLIAAYHKSDAFLDQPAIEHAHTIRPGVRLGPYEVIELAGAGGMGEVYRARDSRLNRDIALKILPPTARHEDARQRLEREARTISSLNHPHICALFDIGRDGEVDYLVMEFLQGETLAVRLTRGPLPREELIRRGIEIADALDRAHRQGVIHCDLKPSNIILTESGAKLLDFGIAKLHDVPDTTAHGTVAYMAPEQLRGDPPDAQTDLFSFGAVLYEMATGRRAFAGETSGSVREAILAGAPVAPARVSPQLDRRLSAIITKALEPARARRYQRAADIRRDLEAALRVPRAGMWPAAAAAVLFAILSGAALLWRGADNVSSAPVRSVAVLPFKPLGTVGTDDDYIGMAIADALIAEFGTIDALAVRPLSASSRYGAPGVDALETGRALDAELVVDGAIQRSGDRLRATVHLINVADGRTIWSDRFESPWTDVFAVQDAIAEQVARALAVTLTRVDRQRVLRRRTANLQAYEQYLKGRYFWSMRTADGLRRALGYFQRAIEEDPRYGPAHAGLADAYALLGSYAVAALPPAEASEKAIAAATRALQIDETLAEAHVSFAFATYSFQWNWELAAQHFKRAIELDPDYPTARTWYSLFLAQLGRLDESLAEAERSLQIEPLSPVSIYSVGLVHYFARRFDLAREYAAKITEVAPEFPHGIRLKGSADIAEGYYQPTIESHERLHAAQPGSSLYAAWLAHAHGKAGNHTRARQILDGLIAASKTRYISAANIAIGYIGLGDFDTALTLMEKGYTERSQTLTFIKIDPVYDPLRADPRFVTLLKRVGLD